MLFKAVDYKSIPQEEVTEEGASGARVRWLITKKDGAEKFSMRHFEIEPAGCSSLHRHSHEHEVFVLKGKCGVTCDGRREILGAGGVVLVPPDSLHQFKNLGNDTLEFLCMIPYMD